MVLAISPTACTILFVVVALLAGHAASTEGNFTILAGGAGRALTFYGCCEVALVPQVSALTNQQFTLELWAKSQSVSPSFTLFSYMTTNRVLYAEISFHQYKPKNERTGSCLFDRRPWRPLFLQYYTATKHNYSSTVTGFSWNGRESFYCYGQQVQLPADAWPQGFNFASWHHFAFTADASQGSCQLYVDGESILYRAVVSPGASVPLNGGALAIGQMQADIATSFDSSRSFQGKVDEIRLWNAAVPQSQIQQRLKVSLLGNDTFHPNLAAYWDMEAWTALVIRDQSRASQNLSLCGWNSVSVICDGTLSTPVFGRCDISGFLSPSTPSYFSVDKSTLMTLPYGIHYLPPNSISPSDGSPLPPLPPLLYEATFDLSKLATQILTLPLGGAIYEVFQNQSMSNEIPRINYTLCRSEISYKPYTIIFSGDYLEYGVTYRPLGDASPSFARGSVIISLNSPPVAKDFSTYTYQNTFKVIQLNCADSDGDQVSTEITSLPARGTLYQAVYNAELRTYAVGQPITIYNLQLSSTVPVANPNNAMIYMPYSNFAGTETFRFNCHDVSNTYSVQNATVSIETKSYYTPPLVGGGLYALQFDGALTFARATNFKITNSSAQRTIDLWINPAGGPKADLQCSTSPARKTQSTIYTSVVPFRQTLVQGVYSEQPAYYFAFGLLSAPLISASSTPSTSTPLNVSPLNYTLFNQSSFILYFRNVAMASSEPNSPTYEVYSDIQIQIPANTWTHVAMTIEQSLVTFYVNGNRAGSASSLPMPIFTAVNVGAQLSWFGASGGTAEFVDPGDSAQLIRRNVFCGTMDELRMWSVSLDQFQIARSMTRKLETTGTILYGDPVVPTPAPLSSNSSSFFHRRDAASGDRITYGAIVSDGKSIVAYWDFNEGLGNATADRSGAQASALVFGSSPADFDRPRWVISDGPQYNQIYTTERAPVLAYLWASALDKSWSDIAMVVTATPLNGTLHQVSANGLLGDEISAAFDPLSRPVIEQWVSSIVSFSSYRSLFGAADAYSPQNIVGPAPSPMIYGDAPGVSWCPATTCNIAATSPEFVIVKYATPVIVDEVEVYQNFNPGSVNRIYAYDATSQAWRLLHQAPPVEASTTFPPTYTVYTPRFCQKMFTTDTLKVEVDPCRTSGWNEIQAIKLIGSTSLYPGVIEDPYGRVYYVPPANQFNSTRATNLDVFSVAVSACPFSPAETSSELSYIVSVTPTNERPMVQDLTIQVRENTDIRIQLRSWDPDGDALNLFISSPPAIGTLYQMDDSTQKADKITDPGTAVTNLQGFVIYSPPDSECGLNFTTFAFLASDSALASDSSLVYLDIYCTPGDYAVSDGLKFTTWSIAGLLMVFCVGLLVFLFLSRANKLMRRAQPSLLAILVLGCLIGYVTVFLFNIPVQDWGCHLRIWLLNFASTTIIGVLVVKIYHMWRTFVAGLLGEMAPQPISAYLGLALFVLIDVIQLIIYTVIAVPHVAESPDPSNPAITLQLCVPEVAEFSPLFLFLWKGILLIIGLVMYVLTRRSTSSRSSVDNVHILAFCLTIFGIAAVVSVPVSFFVDRSQQFLVAALGVAVPYTITLLFVFAPKMLTVFKKRPAAENDFGLKVLTPNPMLSPSSNPSQSDFGLEPKRKTRAPNFSEDVNVLELLEHLQSKESEIVGLRSKLLKAQHKIRALRQRIASFDGRASIGSVSDDDDEYSLE